MGRVFVNDTLERLKTIAEKYWDEELHPKEIDGLTLEVAQHEANLRSLFEVRKQEGPSLGPADTDAYFSEKLVGVTSFVSMAYDPDERGEYSRNKATENIEHYAGLVQRLLPSV